MAKASAKGGNCKTSGHHGRVTSRARRWEWFRALRRISALEKGVHLCQRALAEAVRVEVIDGKAHVGKIGRCGSPWACPLCGPIVRESHAREIDLAVAAWLDAGGGVLMASFTFRHKGHGPLAHRMTVVKKAYGSMTSGRRWQAATERFGLVGSIKATETTWGEKNGWHPHLHVLMFTRRPLDERARVLLEAALFERWRKFVVKAGGDEPSRRRGVDLRVVRRNNREQIMGQYLAKVEGGWGAGLELARGDVKRKGQSAWTQLETFLATGDKAALERFNEYEQATKGVHSIRWSPTLANLRRSVSADADLTDEERAAAKVLGVTSLVVLIPAGHWRALIRWGLVPEYLTRIESAAALGRVFGFAAPWSAPPGVPPGDPPVIFGQAA